MNPGVVIFIAFVLLRVFRVMVAANKRKQANSAGMDDLSGRSMPQSPRGERRNINMMNPMNRRQTGSAQLGGARVARPKHKRDREDPFDGMHGDVTQAKLTMDDIVTK